MASDDSEERSAFGFSDIVSVALAIAMVVVGVQYNDEKYCKNQASLYLIAGGGITLALTGLKILTCFICDSKCYAMLSILVTIGSFGFAIWGAVAIFGAYSTWDYEDQAKENFCEYTPYMFAFVLLILTWVLLPASLCCALLTFCGIITISAIH